MTGTNGKSAKAAGALAVALGLVVVSCDEEVLPPDAAETAAPGMRASALSTSVHVDTLPPELFGAQAGDSAASAPGDGEAGGAVGATEGASIVLSERSDVTVDVAFTETAAQNTLRIVEPISQELASGNPISGSFRFGPFEAGTVVAFDLLSGALGRSALQRLSGVGPCWLLEFEDSRDNDFNDLVLLINAVPPGEPKEPTGPGATVRFEPAAVRIETRADGTKVTTEPTRFIVSYRAVTACAEEPVQAEIEIHEARSEVHIGPRLETFHVEGRGELVWDVPVGTPVTPNTSTPRVCLFATYRAPSGFGNEFFTFLRDCTGPPDSLVVELRLDKIEVPPVLDRRFNAVTQEWSDELTPHRLYDVVDLEVRASRQPSGRPASGARLVFTVEPVEGSGGHPHAGRPSGSFFRTEDRPTAGDQKKGVVRPTLELTTGEDGRARAVYRSSGISGLEVIRVAAAVDADTAKAADTLVVRLPEGDLVAVDTLGTANYTFESGNSHSPVQNFLAPGVIQHMDSIWAGYQERHRRDPRRYPLSIPKFVVTGASVKWGGLYDIERNWRNPHRLHRTGHDVDFDAGALLESTANRQAMVDHCAKYSFNGVETTCEVHADTHFHAYVGPTFYHR